ncbi:MAG: ATP-dependent zinc metalloprotease FtsH [Candidatus Omnitrophota bacterium]
MDILEPKKQKKETGKKNNKAKKSIFNNPYLFWFVIIFLVFYFSSIVRFPFVVKKPPQQINYSEFYKILLDNDKTNKIKSLVLTVDENKIEGEFSDGSQFNLYIPIQDEEIIPLMRQKVSNFEIRLPRTLLANLLFNLGGPILLIFALWYLSFRGNQMGNRIWSFSKIRPKLASDVKEQKRFTFDDVAGVDEAEEELTEVIEFLKDPKKFQRLGGKIPKGVLLVGPPGTGKTLLAKAVAGEAGVPFFSISGSDFVEMFVGVGASRVRDLFEQGRQAAKVSGKGCIIFIDEIDAVGRLRFSGIGGGHDEREQTLNALLVEMDGFTTQEGLILIAATNRPDTLDPALLRPGRFDRQIVIDRPDIKGREAILKVHVRNIKLAEDVSLESIARQTPGFSGADLANLANEAALLAARRNKEKVGMEEMQESIERVIAGPQRKSRVISKKEKEIVAFHEAGHALLSLLVSDVDPLHKVSIIPRGTAALGYTMQLPLQDRYIMTKSELLARLTVLLGGCSSEELIFGEVTTGAENDLEVATELARRMVCEFGMSEKLGHLTFGRRRGLLFLGKDLTEERNYSEDTAREIDVEVKRLVEERYKIAKKTLEENKDKLSLLASTLLEKEVLAVDEIRKLLNIS